MPPFLIKKKGGYLYKLYSLYNLYTLYRNLTCLGVRVAGAFGGYHSEFGGYHSEFGGYHSRLGNPPLKNSKLIFISKVFMC